MLFVLLEAASKVSQVLSSFSGSHVGFHETFTNSLLSDLKVRSFFSFSSRLTQAGQAHVSLVMGVYSLWLIVIVAVGFY
jgi:hypothetical protein